jgi:hypothetical protein
VSAGTATGQGHGPGSGGPPTEAFWLGDTTRSPVTICIVGAIVASFVAVGFLAAYLPRTAPLGPPIGLLVASGVLTFAGAALLRARPGFAWSVFWSIARWVVLVTLVFAAMAEYVFAYDKTTGAPLVIMTVVLALAAVDVPIVVAFSVARHEQPATG